MANEGENDRLIRFVAPPQTHLPAMTSFVSIGPLPSVPRPSQLGGFLPRLDWTLLLLLSLAPGRPLKQCRSRDRPPPPPPPPMYRYCRPLLGTVAPGIVKL
ncbi:hypothetical protein CDAR_527791 [Caerostris darwini]|uniref:Uncharacterized protein n=1 Tax=Caerostris darwini TaxID=1538125 RepID=A0AAV4RDK4_9ARAC|nr:hypothetical protein CDAR_527791 [Caerostris darwini]